MINVAGSPHSPDVGTRSLPRMSDGAKTAPEPGVEPTFRKVFDEHARFIWRSLLGSASPRRTCPTPASRSSWFSTTASVTSPKGARCGRSSTASVCASPPTFAGARIAGANGSAPSRRSDRRRRRPRGGPPIGRPWRRWRPRSTGCRRPSARSSSSTRSKSSRWARSPALSAVPADRLLAAARRAEHRGRDAGRAPERNGGIEVKALSNPERLRSAAARGSLLERGLTMARGRGPTDAELSALGTSLFGGAVGGGALLERTARAGARPATTAGSAGWRTLDSDEGSNRAGRRLRRRRRDGRGLASDARDPTRGPGPVSVGHGEKGCAGDRSAGAGRDPDARREGAATLLDGGGFGAPAGGRANRHRPLPRPTKSWCCWGRPSARFRRIPTSR